MLEHECNKNVPSDWEKIIANEAPDKGLISKIYKQLLFFFIPHLEPMSFSVSVP